MIQISSRISYKKPYIRTIHQQYSRYALFKKKHEIKNKY